MAAGSLGVVLRTTAVRDSDLIVQLYTDTHGQVSAIARGARRSQRRFAGALQLFVLARYQLGRPPRGELWSLESAEIEREWTHNAADIVAVAHASYLAELVGAVMPAEAPDPHVLDVIVALWTSLAQGGPSPSAMRAVELAVLELAGHKPSLAACVVCGETQLDRGSVFDPTRGGVVCRACAPTSRGPGVRPIDPATRAYLRAVSGHDLDLASARALDTAEPFTGADRTAAREAIVATVLELVGHPLRSLEFIAKLGAAARKPT